MDDYAPRSPDLSALGSIGSHGSPEKKVEPSHYSNYPPTYQDSFSSLPQSSYYRAPISALQQAQHSSYTPPSRQQVPSQHLSQSYPQSSSHPYDHYPIKAEDKWLPQQAHRPAQSNMSASGQEAKRVGRKGGQQPPEPNLRPPAPGDAEGIVVKTKFPVARIKRIVQADEEVGKVAQATPVAVGKALELFMIQMTLSAISEAQSRGSKRLAAPHIKAAIIKDDKFDFLKDIGDKIPDDPGTGRRRGAGEGKAKVETASEEDIDMESEAKSKRRSRAGKKRKVTVDD